MSPFDASFSRLALIVRDLCQLRRGPEDMPYSTTLLGVLIAADTLIDVIIGTAVDGAPNVLARSLVSTALVLALCWIAVSMRHFGNRFVQTASALIACSILFSLLLLPLAWASGPAPASPEQMTALQWMTGWGMLAIVVWNLVVNAHILRRALDAPFGLGFALALAWAVADWAIGHALFG